MKPEYKPELVALDAFMKGMGRSNITGWRWRKKKWLETINIDGREYLTREAIDKFLARAAAGEFSKELKVPVAPLPKRSHPGTYIRHALGIKNRG